MSSVNLSIKSLPAFHQECIALGIVEQAAAFYAQHTCFIAKLVGCSYYADCIALCRAGWANTSFVNGRLAILSRRDLITEVGKVAAVSRKTY